MPQEIPVQNLQQSDLPVAEFNVRTGKPTGAKQTVGKKVLEISDVKIAKGKWLRDKLTSLYDDPKFKTASPEQQKAYKELAYAKWVQPYYTKVLKTNAPTKEDWLTGSTHSLEGTEAKDRPIEGAYKKAGAEFGLHTMKTTTDITAGLLRNVADAIDWIGNPDNDLAVKKLRGAQGFLEKKGSEWQGRLDDLHNHQEKSFKQDVPGKIAELGTQTIFFEATGAAKAAKIFNVANPKTAGLALQMAKASWNGAVDFTAWSASQGDKPEEIKKSAIIGATTGGILKASQRKGFDPLFGIFKDLFKWGGAEATKQVINEAVSKVSSDKPEVVISNALSEQSKKASTIAASELEKYSQEKFKRSFKDLGYIQKAHILNKLLAVTADAAKTVSNEGMPKQIVQAHAKEQDELMAQIFPEAKISQQKVDEFVKQSGLEPQSTKLLATLPHHNTTIDSPWKHLQARASFLKSRLRTAKGPEREAILKAYNEEYALMKEKAARQKIKGTVGGAAAGDPRAFHGEQYVVTPYVDPYNTGFADWHSDSFASKIMFNLRRQAAFSVGHSSEFLANAISNSFIIGTDLSRKARLQEGITKHLLHDQFGIVGGINYEVQGAAGLGERSGFGANEKILYINYLGMRPNVVARVWPVKGGGQTLFLHAAEEANRQNIGIALLPFDESKSFYEKMGMKEIGSYMVLDKNGVKKLLQDKGLLMMLLGAGITYGASKELSQGDYSVKGSN